MKKCVLKTSANFTGNACRPATLLKETPTYVFSCDIEKLLRTPFSQNISGRLPLVWKGYLCVTVVMDNTRSSHRRCSVKKAGLKNFRNFIGNHLCWSLFLIVCRKKRLQHRCFPVKFAKFVRTPPNVCFWEWYTSMTCTQFFYLLIWIFDNKDQRVKPLVIDHKKLPFWSNGKKCVACLFKSLTSYRFRK